MISRGCSQLYLFPETQKGKFLRLSLGNHGKRWFNPWRRTVRCQKRLGFGLHQLDLSHDTIQQLVQLLRVSTDECISRQFNSSFSVSKKVLQISRASSRLCDKSKENVQAELLGRTGQPKLGPRAPSIAVACSTLHTLHRSAKLTISHNYCYGADSDIRHSPTVG